MILVCCINLLPGTAFRCVVAADPQPFAGEAKHFVESRLLHRNVGLRIGGADKFGNLYGTLEHSAGNISVELLKAGLAKMVDWSLSELRGEPVVALFIRCC